MPTKKRLVFVGVVTLLATLLCFGVQFYFDSGAPLSAEEYIVPVAIVILPSALIAAFSWRVGSGVAVIILALAIYQSLDVLSKSGDGAIGGIIGLFVTALLAVWFLTIIIARIVVSRIVRKGNPSGEAIGA